MVLLTFGSMITSEFFISLTAKCKDIDIYNRNTQNVIMKIWKYGFSIFRKITMKLLNNNEITKIINNDISLFFITLLNNFNIFIF